MRHLLYLPIRTFSASAQSVEKNLLSKLRKQTGVPFINCKKALTKFNNDFDQAKKWLLEEAQKEGWTRATKLQSRPMSQGLVGVLADKGHATMIEVNCETDFVAKNEKFIAMVSKLVEGCSNYLQGSTESEVTLNKAKLDQIKTPENATLADIIALTIGDLGENMALRRGVFLRAADGNCLSSYVHPSGGGNEAKRLMIGKYGAVVELAPPTLNSQDEDEPSLRELGRDLCQHIVGMNPVTVGEYSSLPTQKDTVTEDGYRSDVSSEEGEECGASQETSQTQLLQQEFLLDSSVSVGEMLEAQGGVAVARFRRFACGEELEGEEE